MLVCVNVSAQYDPNKASAYEALQRYEFPVGLLPEGVSGYSLNESSGEFWAHLNRSCSFTLENSYELRYEPEIKGLLSKGRLEKLSGVSVKVVLVWLNIVQVKRNRQSLHFSVGFKSADFPVENFEECPRCGCGFDCSSSSNYI
ncbi:uncharacterized protein LOC131016598 [Salvia miltiorrhiza]|uniref:uncharacterized protein LOC131016598 n=1 Tax=Salvia miltiorrhiza TaxID=226208 RepID=UPI0025AC4E53|nr:uncharacterized protein LOC131016598 [Salvia miltiorrhiza]